MGLLNANVLTLADWAKRVDPEGKVPSIIELLNQTNEVLDDMLWAEGNLATGHRTVVRTGLPTVAWRLLNNGVTSSKSTTAQIDEACAMLEAWSEVDKDLALLNGNTADFRMSEATAFIEAMNQEMAQTLFYGNASVSPEEFTGLAIRYSDPAATNGSNVIDAAGADANDSSSIWLICWGSQTISGIFPKGSQAGLFHEDLGLQTVENAGGIGGAKMRVFQDHWQWKCGIALKDWRYVVRIGSIDMSTLIANSAPPNLILYMVKAIHRIPFLKLGKPVFYMNRTVFEFLDIQRMASVNTGGGITYENVDGKAVPMFRGIPIKIVDALLETESLV